MERKNLRMYEPHESCEPKTVDHLYKIGMFAQMNHVTIKTLRFYEEQGLLAPAHVDPDNGYRYYTLNQMEIIHRITALKQAGFTLEDIRHINSGTDENLLLQKKKSQLLSKIAELTKQVAAIDGYLIGHQQSLVNPVLMKTLPKTTCVVMEKRIETYDELFDLMPTMGAEMERCGYECALPEYCFIRYVENGYKEKDVLVEICESVTAEREATDLIQCKEIEEVNAACIFHKGSYDRLQDSYEMVLRYIEENGYEICGSIRESYIDGVWNKETEEEWLTEIQVPVR